MIKFLLLAMLPVFWIIKAIGALLTDRPGLAAACLIVAIVFASFIRVPVQDKNSFKA